MLKKLTKKRGVSPVIATVLLIALVTAAAAIVFLVVLPMMQPSGELIVTANGDLAAYNDTSQTFSLQIKALGADVTIDSISVDGTSTEIVTTPLTINNGQTRTFTVRWDNSTTNLSSTSSYTITVAFSYGDSEGLWTGSLTLG